MTDTTIVGMISTVGFPIVAFLLMFYHNTTTLKEIRKSVDASTMATKEMIREIRRQR